MSLDGYLSSTAEQAQRARREARANAGQDSPPSQTRIGVVAAVSGGFYSVDLVGADGTTVVDTLIGLRVWGSGSYAVGARVFVVYSGARPIPYIFGTGGGGSGIEDPKGVVTEDNGDGTYDVDLLQWADETTVIDSLTNIRPWPPRKLFVGDYVWLKFDPAGSGAMGLLT